MPKVQIPRGCLSHLAFRSPERAQSANQCGKPSLDSLGDPFAIDAFKLFCSPLLNRLRGIMQVVPFSDHDNHHISNRYSHTMEVMSIAIAISGYLGLNTPLTNAASIGHDIGQPPYCHFGEHILTDLLQQDGRNVEFLHEIFGVILAQITKLNLTYETSCGILNHSGLDNIDSLPRGELPEETIVLKISDKIAFIFRDIGDLARQPSFVGKTRKYRQEANWFGKTIQEQTLCCIQALIEESVACGQVSFEKSKVAQRFIALRHTMYDEVYSKLNHDHHKEDFLRAFAVVRRHPLFARYDPYAVAAVLNEYEVATLASLKNETDATISAKIEPARFEVLHLLPYLKGKQIDFTRPVLNPAPDLFHSPG